MLATPGRAAFTVDEAVTVTEDELGAHTLGDLVRRGRHFGLEVHVLTQRVTDWFDTRIRRTIQSVAASKWFGQMEPRELVQLAPSLGISPATTRHAARAWSGCAPTTRRCARPPSRSCAPSGMIACPCRCPAAGWCCRPASPRR